jgi:hypothetical protein
MSDNDTTVDDKSDGNSICSNECCEPSSSTLRQDYVRLVAAHRRRRAQDKEDVEQGLERERRFTVEYNKMSRNKLWAVNAGPECAYYDGSPDEYKHQQNIWPRGRDLHSINLYSQLLDFFRFMWQHTKPYSGFYFNDVYL